MPTKYTKKPWKYKIIDTKERVVVQNNLTLLEAYYFIRSQDVKVHLRTVPVDYDTAKVIKERKAK